MTKRLSNKIVAIAALAMGISRCGVDKEAHYNPFEKNYGINEASDSSNEANSSFEPAGTQDDTDGLILNGDRDDYSIKPDDIIFDALYMGYPSRPSVQLIYQAPLSEVEVVAPEASKFYGRMRPVIDEFAKMSVELIAQQTHGTDKESYFTQLCKVPLNEGAKGGASIFKEQESDSGVIQYKRVLKTEECPDDLVCISRASKTPKVGLEKSFCFYSVETQKVVGFPIGASPGVRKADILRIPKEYGPFEIREFYGNDVNCSAPGVAPNRTTKARVSIDLEVSKRKLALLTKQTHANASIDFGVVIHIIPVNQDNTDRSPNALLSSEEPLYLDQLTGLQSKTVYYFNEEAGSLLRIVKTFRKPLNGNASVAKQARLIGYQGIMVDLHFQFCQNRLVANSKNICIE